MTDHYDARGRLLDEPDLEDAALDSAARLFRAARALLWATENLREMLADLLEHGDIPDPYRRYAEQALRGTAPAVQAATGQPAPTYEEVIR